MYLFQFVTDQLIKALYDRMLQRAMLVHRIEFWVEEKQDPDYDDDDVLWIEAMLVRSMSDLEQIEELLYEYGDHLLNQKCEICIEGV